MTAQIAAYGRLVDDPQVKQTSKGTPMTLARMAVSLPCSQAQDGQATLPAYPARCRSASGPDRTGKRGRVIRLLPTA